MRLSRNRNWGHPDLIALIERLSAKAKQVAGWPGILIGDMSQPRGGPMWDGHNSHQVGLDADIYLTPMPNRELSRAERELVETTDGGGCEPDRCGPKRLDAGTFRGPQGRCQGTQVERIFVNPAIKKALCREATGDRGWLNKVRPMHGHDYHFHIRIKCRPIARVASRSLRFRQASWVVGMIWKGGSSIRSFIPSQSRSRSSPERDRPVAAPCSLP